MILWHDGQQSDRGDYRDDKNCRCPRDVTPRDEKNPRA